MSKAKSETVQKSTDGWAFMHPNGEWTGAYKTRVEARAARSAVLNHDDADDLGANKVVDTPAEAHVDSEASKTSDVPTPSPEPSVTEKESKIMANLTLSLDPKTRKSTSVVFKLPAGLRGSVRIAKTAFPGGVPPTSLSLQSDNENAFATAKAKLTAEERKAMRKDQPKLTPAQKLQKLQERAAKLQAKIAAEASASAQPQA